MNSIEWVLFAGIILLLALTVYLLVRYRSAVRFINHIKIQRDQARDPSGLYQTG